MNIEFYDVIVFLVERIQVSASQKSTALNDDGGGDDDAANVDHELFECALKNYSQSRKWSHFY